MVGTKMREFNSIAVRFQIITRLNRRSAWRGPLRIAISNGPAAWNGPRESA